MHNYLDTKRNRSMSRPTNIVDLLKKSKLEEKKEKRHNIFVAVASASVLALSGFIISQ